MGHEFPERRKKAPPTEPARENIARSQQRGGQRDKEIHPLSHSLSLGLSVRVKVQPAPIPGNPLRRDWIRLKPKKAAAAARFAFIA